MVSGRQRPGGVNLKGLDSEFWTFILEREVSGASR